MLNVHRAANASEEAYFQSYFLGPDIHNPWHIGGTFLQGTGAVSSVGKRLQDKVSRPGDQVWDDAQ